MDLLLSIGEPPTGGAQKYLCGGGDFVGAGTSTLAIESMKHELQLRLNPKHAYKLGR